MRAAVFHSPGAPLTIEQVPDPEVSTGDLVIAVHRCGICGSDLHMADMHGPDTGMAALPAGTVMGHEFAGEVVAVGREAGDFKVGDRVTAMPYIACGRCAACLTGFGYRCANACYSALGQEPGGYAEYMRVGAAETLRLPDGVDDALGAFVEPFAVGLHGVNAARLRPGERVLIMGAGPVGLACAAWARHFGARDVIFSDFSAARRALAERIGATATVDPGSESVPGACKRIAGRRPDVILECVGVPGTQQLAMDYAPMGGRIVVLGVCMAPDRIQPVKALTKELQINYAYMYSRQEFELTIDALDRERIDPSPMLTRTVGFADFAAAFEGLKTDKTACKVMLNPRA
ncbi:MAG: alcohol dehydrogenase catalytic domain-containing protein [Gammaproteobacteria bacterium]